jgi:hypothetical protein
VVVSGDSFLDASPNMYLHQNLAIEGGIVLNRDQPLNDLYERYVIARDLGAQRSNWEGLSVESMRESHPGGNLLIDRNMIEVDTFIERLAKMIPSS